MCVNLHYNAGHPPCHHFFFLLPYSACKPQLSTKLLFVIGGSTGQRGSANGFKHPGQYKHERMQQPIWLLVLEIATGVLLVVFVITGIVTASRSCKLKPSIRISSWNRSKSWSDEITVLIGKC